MHADATKERVLGFVENIDKELRKTGIMEPLIAVAALNLTEGITVFLEQRK
ncbi:MAG: hypothetical protein ACLR0U_27700 [Enterocloster clostridioformis]